MPPGRGALLLTLRGERRQVWTGDDILTAVAGHARDDHGLTDIPASLVDQVRAAIHTV